MVVRGKRRAREVRRGRERCAYRNVISFNRRYHEISIDEVGVGAPLAPPNDVHLAPAH